MDTWLLEFCLSVDKVLQEKDEFLKKMENVVNDLATGCRLVYQSFGRHTSLFFSDKETVSVVIHLKEDGICTADVNCLEISDNEFNSKIKTFTQSIQSLSYYQSPPTPEYLSLPKIVRGRAFSRYDATSDKILERDFDRLVFDEVTPFQHIRILHSEEQGNIVYVDNDSNIGESDYPVSPRTFTGQIDYTGKTVLIMGGGDGCLLRYALDKNPKMITVVDIDQKMIDAAKLYLRGLCEDVLETMKCEKYEIIVGDAVKYLEKSKAEGRKFDIILNDIVTIPEPTWGIGSDKDFFWKILLLSLEILRKNGAYAGHGTSLRNTETLENFEQGLKVLEYPVTIKRNVAFIPSYLEYWVFYSLTKGV